MKRIISIILTVVMMMSVTVVLGVTSYGANEPEITVDNYTVTITEADSIKDMRYALGTYTTTSEIKAAEGNVAISNALVVKYTVDGNFVYEMPKGGYYTIWIRMQDGTNYIKPLDVTNFTPYVSAYGVKVTIHNLYDVKDFFIAKGEFSTYREIKDNGYIFNATSAKIAGKHDYTYTVYEPGVHTVLIRYNDGTQKIFHETLTVDEPVFTENGLQITVSNLPDVKVIRTAYGEWSTVKELKATDTIRNFSAKTAIKGKDPYTIQYRDEGIVTVIVEYNNGYVKAYHYDVQAKEPTVVQNGNEIKFGELDGLVMIRYAEGKYTTSGQIKAAAGSKVIKNDAIVDGTITVSDLTVGKTYTFCVQYDDESFNYYTVTVTEEVQPEPPETTEPTFVVSDVTATAGDTVDVTVAVKNNPGLASIGMHVSYADALSLNSVTFNTAIGGNPYVPQNMTSPVKLVWVSPFADVEGDWTFVTLNFTVASDAVAGDYAVTVSYNEDDVYDLTESNVYFDVDNGVVTVK